MTAKRDRPRRRAGARPARTMRRVLAELEKQGVDEDRRADDRAVDVPRVRLPGVRAAGADRLPRHPARDRCTCASWRRAARAVAAAVEAGGNGVRVRDIRLEVGDPDAVLEKARDAAVEAATAKAEQYAARDRPGARRRGQHPRGRRPPRRAARRRAVDLQRRTQRGPGRPEAPDPGREGRPEGAGRGGLGVRVASDRQESSAGR